jgi:hypothetical protein
VIDRSATGPYSSEVEGPGFRACLKTPLDCHSEPFAVILSEAKDLALGAQGKLREESRSEYFQGTARFSVASGSPENHPCRPL